MNHLIVEMIVATVATIVVVVADETGVTGDIEKTKGAY